MSDTPSTPNSPITPLGPHTLPSLVAFLEDGLLERDAASRLVLLAAVAGEHVLLVGPPGTAKSELARRLQALVGLTDDAPGSVGENGAPSAGGGYFERLLTRFSTPEELFGPLSLKALEEDRYERLVQGYLPTAQVAFLDEVFKANSAILNALLSLLNERVFDNGVQRLNVPLVTVVGASNEVPSDEALLAFHDRFLLRVPVEPVGDQAFAHLLAPAPGRMAEPEHRLSPAWRHGLAAAAQALALSESALVSLRHLRGELQARSIRVSDRRWRQFGALLRLAAAAEGRPTVEAVDLWLAAYVAAAEPSQTAALLQWWMHEVMAVGPSDAPEAQRTVEAFEKQLEIETLAQAEEGADAAGKMALARSIGGADGQGASSEMLRLYSARVEEKLRKRWSPLHVQARVAQVEEQTRRTQDALVQAQQHVAALEAQLCKRLWLPPSLAEAALAAPRARAALLADLVARLQVAGQGFATLPVDEALSATPLPIVA